MTNIAIIGSGRVGSNLAAGLARAGHAVTLGTTDGRKPEGWTGPELPFALLTDAVSGAAVVINATPGDVSLDVLTPLRADLAGKVLVDVANATGRGPDGLPGDLLFPGDSLAERLQAALPETRVVKTLNTMLFPVHTNPQSLATPPTAFLSGDDAEAKATVTALLVNLGWPEGWILDLGGLATARGPEAMILVVPHVLRRRGMRPFALALAT